MAPEEDIEELADLLEVALPSGRPSAGRNGIGPLPGFVMTSVEPPARITVRFVKNTGFDRIVRPNMSTQVMFAQRFWPLASPSGSSPTFHISPL